MPDESAYDKLNKMLGNLSPGEVIDIIWGSAPENSDKDATSVVFEKRKEKENLG